MDNRTLLDLGTYTIINNVGKSRTYMTQFPILEPDILGSEEFNKLSVNERFEKSLVTT